MHKYIEKINSLQYPTFQQIRNIANKSIDDFSNEERQGLWKQLNHGVDLLYSHELMCQYLWSFGNMHEAKIHAALKGINKAELIGEFDIIDWGCGQGLATIAFFDFLKDHHLKTSVKNIILIEPSKMALERAKLHISAYQKDRSKIKIVEKYLNDVTNSDIKTDGLRPVIHFFSNILDIKDIDLKDISVKLNQALLNENYVVSVGPIYAGNRRIDAFYDYFKVSDIFEINESQFNYGGNKTCTCKALVYKLGYNENGILTPIEFYPSVQFHACYELDCIKQKREQFTKLEKEKFKNITNNLNRCETYTPFDIGASVYDDVHPILAVLNNIVTRGLPTKASPFIESLFEQSFGYTKEKQERGEISFYVQKGISYKEILIWVENTINSSLIADYTGIETTQLQLILTPIAIARIQKTILEALMTDKLDFNQESWKILVEEKDVPCAAIAFRDLEQMFNCLTQLSIEYQGLKFPSINLEIISTPEFCNSPLHLDFKTTTKVLPVQSNTEYDLVINIAVLQKSEIDKNSFSKFKCKNKCYFNIRSAYEKKSDRVIYTSNPIQYRDLVKKDFQGKYSNIKETKELLKYFLQLIFRKEDFRPGQLPILNRALQNKGVIGLLPTGGGKSLTYQLAAMLQPGVTLIVDPLSSLMKDQYDSLRNLGIDCCIYINSTINSEEKKRRETLMESSQALFVFLSPERLGIYQFRERLKNMHELHVYFSYGVIDEVHCVSEWGHDFRFSYLHLGRNLYKYVRAKEGRISLFGLTATASFDVLADVERELSGESAFNLDADTIVRYENTNRLELQYKIEKVKVKFENDDFFDKYNELDPGLPKAVRFADNKAFGKAKNSFLSNYINILPTYVTELQTYEAIKKIKTSFEDRQEPDENINNILNVEMPYNFFEPKEHYEQAGIIFCPHKDNTGLSVKVNQSTLQKTIQDVGAFLGGDETDNSMNNLELFRDSKLPIMVATKAFGMGIDKPNVRFTVNMNYSSSLESFVQEAGRAGRDRKMALSTILISDYKLARINNKFQSNNHPFRILKNKWFNTEDLKTILKHYNVDVDSKYIDYCTPEHDFVRIYCSTSNKIFAFNNCKDECEDFVNCKLSKVPRELKGWHFEKDFKEILAEKNIVIDKKQIQFQNADYETVMYFYNNSFKGATIEKQFMHKLLSVDAIELFYGDDTEIKHNELKTFNGFLTSLFNAAEDIEIVSFIPYTSPDKTKKIEGNDTDIAKAIYRMSCIGLIEDFTQDYSNNRFRIVSKNKAEGEYFNSLNKFLLRYYTEDRAKQEISKAFSYKLNKISDNNKENEIHRCLAYLTEFVYEKISIKRKRAIDDMRNFCIQGIDETKDWKIINEELKDFIYYYFNSKYAKDDYVADNGIPYSLTIDTQKGKFSSEELLFKYLKVIDDDLVGVGTPIDNVKHLQGAVRLIRRSLTDNNPTLYLLNAFCLLFLGTKGNENLERELVTSYKEGMEEFENRIVDSVEFWNLFDKYNAVINQFSNKKQLTKLKQEIMLTIHGNKLKTITDKYLQ